MSAKPSWQKTEPTFVRPEILDVLGASTIVKSDPTVVRVLVTERTFPPGHCSPVHAHETDDELLYVLEGEITVIDNGVEMKAGPGCCVALPRGRVHAYRNENQTDARGLLIAQPGIHAVEFFRNLDRASRAARAAGRSLSESEADEIARQYGVQVTRN